MSSETEWTLVELLDVLELEDTENDDTVRMREHFTLRRKRKRHASNAHNPETGQLSGVIQYCVGGVTKTKSLPSTKKYLCISDGIASASGQEGDEWVTQEQEWEYYSPWQEVDVTSSGLPSHSL